jgi:hypothetical protein
MDEMFIIHPKIYERSRDLNLAQATQIFDRAPGWKEHLALAAGRFFIATGEKLVRLSSLPTQMEKKAV